MQWSRAHQRCVLQKSQLRHKGTLDGSYQAIGLSVLHDGAGMHAARRSGVSASPLPMVPCAFCARLAAPTIRALIATLNCCLVRRTATGQGKTHFPGARRWRQAARRAAG